MLESRFEVAKWRACHIVSEFGDEALRVFPYAAPLIHSDKASIRDIACECYRWSATTGMQVAEVIKCLEDKSGRVRFRAMLALRDFSKELIQAGVEALRAEGADRLSEAIERSLLKGDAKSVAIEIARKETRLNKLCYYLSALRQGVEGKARLRIMRRLKEPDLTYFHRR
ncbi:hypothetical protein AEYBE204_07440 [Asticcacaulis sp. YBE204]|nr:hypothetical protein AEYBE204_07440 [Asticcacaulis sp. YBE204]